LLSNTKDENELRAKKYRVDSSYPRTHTRELAEKYREYLAQADDLHDDFKNSRNLFAELNSTDTRWFNIARLNLSRSR
jgi:hypothetical protein